MLGQPAAAEQVLEQGFIQAARLAVVKVLGAGHRRQPGFLKPVLQAAVSPFGPFPIDQQAEAVGKAQRVAVGHLELFPPGLAHAGEFQFLQLIQEGLVQHRRLRLSGSRPGHANWRGAGEWIRSSG